MPQPGDRVRPLVMAQGSHVLAGGWCRFSQVEVRNGPGRAVVNASDIDDDTLTHLIAPRGTVAGMDMARPNIMGILNVTPDSFSDGGRFNSTATGLDQAMAMVAQGADILDIGGESTRPGAQEVSIDEELDRTIPVIQSIRARSDVPISIDTRKATVGQAALDAGATVINDVSAFVFDPGLAQVTANAGAPACLMHAQGLPDTMQDNPTYTDVVAEVASALSERVHFAERQGVAQGKIIIDPGIGFGKTLDHNLQLMQALSQLHGLGLPILVGASRKRFIGTLTGVENAGDRVHGSVAVALAAIAQGAQIVRVHDVAATKQAITMWMAIQNGESH
ncbi:MAG: dihydropteroate synthase [Pseudomonadota bacterium]